MGAPSYLGDELGAAAWRLAGAEARATLPAEATSALARARARSPLVLLSASTAEAVDEAALGQALSALSPLVLIVPDLDGRTPPDLAARLRAQLGMEA